MASKLLSEPDSPESTLPPDLIGAKLLTTDQAAELLGDISRRTLEDWRRLGTGPDYVPISPSRVRYRPAAIAEFIESRERKLSAKKVA